MPSDRWASERAEVARAVADDAPICAITTKRLAALLAEQDQFERALEFYADPEIYKPHPHGPAFDRRDESGVALAALNFARAKTDGGGG